MSRNTPNPITSDDDTDILVHRTTHVVPSNASHAAKDEVRFFYLDVLSGCDTQAQAIKHLQLTVGRLEDEVKRLKERKAVLEEMLDTLDPRWKQKADLPAILRHKGDTDEIQSLGRAFGVMHYPWLDDWAFLRPRPPLPDPSMRFESEETMRDAIINSLFDFVPAKYHEVMENHSGFGEMVCPCFVSNFCYTLTTQLIHR